MSVQQTKDKKLAENPFAGPVSNESLETPHCLW